MTRAIGATDAHWGRTGSGALLATLTLWLGGVATAQRRPTEVDDLDELRDPQVGEVGAQTDDPTGTESDDQPWSVRLAVGRPLADEDEWLLLGALLRDPKSGLTIEAERVVVRLDRDLRSELLQQIESDGDLPRRGPRIPRSRRRLGGETVRATIESFLRSLGPGSELELPDGLTDRLELIRSIYIEGGVRIAMDGLEVLRAESLSWSILDDRVLIEDATLRYDTGQTRPRGAALDSAQLTIRTPELVRQAGRFVARDARVTSDPRAVPSFEVESREIELFEIGEAFRIRTRGNSLLYRGSSVVPLPDQTWDTDQDSNIPLKSLSLGYSNREGVILSTTFGGSFSETLKSVIESLGGDPDDGLRANWRLGRGWIERRGIPLEPQIEIQSERFQTRVRAFGLEDKGSDIGFVRLGPDRRLINEEQRRLVEAEGRIQLTDGTRLDFDLFDAGDAGVYPEFYRGDFIRRELPETSLHLRSASENLIGTVTADANLANFDYTDSRRVATSTPYLEELPRATLDLFSEQLGEVFDTPLLLSTSTDVAWFRQDFATGTRTDTGDLLPDRESARLDQRFELSTPFALGPIRVRPYAASQFTYYDRGPAFDDGDGRSAFSAGVEIGTRIAKTFSWLNADGSTQRVRHVLVPTIRYDDVFSVSDSPTDFYQFDGTDAVTETRRVRFGLLQRFLTRRVDQNGQGDTKEFLWIDLAQNVFPDADRDNGGEALGFSEWEVILRDTPAWLWDLPVRLVFEGEYDWVNREIRTLNNYFEIRTGLPRWFAEYRTDTTDDGQVGYGVAMPFRNRWRVLGRALYDLDRDEHINYTAELTRFDPNFALAAGLRFDNIRDEVSFTIDFEFILGGLVDQRRRRTLNGADSLARNHPAF